jgi:Zn finger protein HypA/HybF involved in hydrogenase expression
LTRTQSFQKKALLENPYKLQTDQVEDNDLHVYQEEQTVDCPDCFDTMIKIYDYNLDKMRYQCENCDLIISAR